MNRDRISDFVDVWAQTLGLTEKQYIDFVKSDIIKRCKMYEKEVPTISVKDDSCNQYLIKPVNNQYSLEDFFLNRLMIGVREIDFLGGLEDHSGGYNAHRKSLFVDAKKINRFVNEIATRHIGLKGKNSQIIKKVIEHELGHCFKTLFNDGFKAEYIEDKEQEGIYKKLDEALSQYKNGKYSNQIKPFSEIENEMESKRIKTGVKHSRPSDRYDIRMEKVDELLNETEALELTNSMDVHEVMPLRTDDAKDSLSGNYVKIFNYTSAYATFSGYGPILKTLLGKENTFRAEYITGDEIIRQFDKEYADIVKDVWGLNPEETPPMQCISQDLYTLSSEKSKYYNENIMLQLDEFFAKCYQKKIEKTISQCKGSISPEFVAKTKQEITLFQSKLTTNDDPKKRDALAHNVVFKNIIDRINELSIQKTQPSVDIQLQEKGLESSQDDIIKKSSKEGLNSRKKQIRSTDITKFINPSLLAQKIQLPNGAEISASQYIQEVVAPQIPGSGRFMLKSGTEISAVQFIEEVILNNTNLEKKGNMPEILENYTKANNGLIQFRGNQINPVDIVEGLNPTLMNNKIALPNGIEITAKQYIQEIFAPHIPSSGMFMLQNGVEITAPQFIEEVLLGNINNYHGDVKLLLEETTKANNGIIDIDEKKQPPIAKEVRQEQGVSKVEQERRDDEEFAKKRREAEEAKRKKDKEKIETDVDKKMSNIDNVILESKVITSEKDEEMQTIKNSRDYLKIMFKSEADRTPEEQAIYLQYKQQREQIKNNHRRQHDENIKKSNGMSL